MWTSEPRDGGTTIIGLGNPLMGDDALGLLVLGRLQQEWTLPDDVRRVDGGTWGLSLLPAIEDAHRVIFIDAVRCGAAPGSLVVLCDEEIPARRSTKLSPHQVDLREVIALARFRGRVPERMVVMGIEPERIELGEPLSPPVAAAVDALLGLVVTELELWGHRCTPRELATQGAAIHA